MVREIERRFPTVRCNTYLNHPWRGWDGRSIDVWGKGTWPRPIALETGHKVLQFVYQQPGEPWIRHYIYLHTLWTSFGGISHWVPDDHSGRRRHLHLTFW